MATDLFWRHPRSWKAIPRPSSASCADIFDARGVLVEAMVNSAFADAIVELVNTYDREANSERPEFRPWSVKYGAGNTYNIVRGDGTVYAFDESRLGCLAIVCAVNESHGYTVDGKSIEPAATHHDRSDTDTIEMLARRVGEMEREIAEMKSALRMAGQLPREGGDD